MTVTRSGVPGAGAPAASQSYGSPAANRRSTFSNGSGASCYGAYGNSYLTVWSVETLRIQHVTGNSAAAFMLGVQWLSLPVMRVAAIAKRLVDAPSPVDSQRLGVQL